MAFLLKKNRVSIVINEDFKKQIIYEYGHTLFCTLNKFGYTPDIYIYLDKVCINLYGKNNLNIDCVDNNFDKDKFIFITKNVSNISQYSNVAAYIDATAIIDSACCCLH